MKLSNVMVGLGVVLSLLLGIVAINRPITQVKTDTHVGGASSDFTTQYISYGGVYNYAFRSDSLLSGTTTVCSINSPAATSTLRFASLRLNTSSTTALSVDISKAAAPGSTGSTTVRFNGTGNITVANGQYDMVASSTGLGAALDTFAPNTPLNFTLNNGSGATFLAPTGACEAQFTTII